MANGGAVLRGIFRLLAMLFATRLVLSAEGLGGAAGPFALFMPMTDFFADSIKSGLAETSVTAGLLAGDPVTAGWPGIFRVYLIANPYLLPGFSIYHSPPLSMLALIGFAASLWLVSPVAFIAAGLAALAGGAMLVARRVSAALALPGAWPMVLGLLALSYPALFMVQRGNLHSGVTSLCLVFYVVGAARGRWRMAGWLALAVAVNLRPNVAVFALMEFIRTPGLRPALRGMVVAGLLSLGLGALSFAAVHAIDPHYTPAAFAEGLELYRRNYVVGLEGLFWNSALANMAKVWRTVLGIEPLYSPGFTLAATLLGAGLGLRVAWAAWRGWLPAPALAFALACLSSLFTPVLAEYHLLVFVAPLVLAAEAAPGAFTDRLLRQTGIGLVLLQLLCLLAWLVPAGATLALVGLAALALPVLALRDGKAAEAGPRLVLIASTAALAPIGGQLTQGYAVGLVLFAALVALFLHRPGDRATPPA